jgi:hypothetical protein
VKVSLCKSPNLDKDNKDVKPLNGSAMTFKTITLISLAAAGLLFFEFYPGGDALVSNKDLAYANNVLSKNEAVNVSGCRTYQRPVAPKVVYPSIRKNFVSRLCALEVFPSNEAIAVSRLRGDKLPIWK